MKFLRFERLCLTDGFHYSMCLLSSKSLMTSQSSEISKMANESQASVSLTSTVRLYSHSPNAPITALTVFNYKCIDASDEAVTVRDSNQA